MTIWERIVENWHELSWHGLFGLDPGPTLELEGRGSKPPATKQVGFTIAVIALAAKMARADGTVSAAEIRAFHEVFHAAPEEQANVDFFFDLARRSATGADSYARQVVRLLDGESTVLEDLLGSLFHIAKADGPIDQAEESYLKRIAAIFGFSEQDYRRLRANHLHDVPADDENADVEDPYTVLGVPPGADVTTIRDHWRALVKEYHPDRAMALGLPAEFVKIANVKLAHINAAYRQLVSNPGTEIT